MKNKMGLESPKSRYDIYLYEDVRIEISGRSITGTVHKIEGNTFYLKPSIIHQNLQADAISKWEHHVILERNIPSMVEISPPYIIYPLKKGYLEKLVNGYKKWKRPKAKAPKPNPPK